MTVMVNAGCLVGMAFSLLTQAVTHRLCRALSFFRLKMARVLPIHLR
jgi:hypothetical protein